MTVVRVTGPTCPNCSRPLILMDKGICLCCGK